MKKKILLIEDDVPIQMAIKELLEGDLPVTVDLAGDGIEGLEMLRKGNYDMYLLDLKMPKMDGLDVLKALKGTPLEQTPFIIISASHVAEKPPADALVIKKPFDLDVFYDAVVKLLKLPPMTEIQTRKF